MKVELVRVDDGFHFEAKGEASEVIVHTDASPNIGGKNKGVRPMELLLMGLGSCESAPSVESAASAQIAGGQFKAIGA